jgi:hypothetical protein
METKTLPSNTKKLSLNKETLRILGDESLKEVAGATGGNTLCDTDGEECVVSEGAMCSQGWPLCGI